MSVTEVIQRLNARRSGKGWQAKCPAHSDHKPSLSIKEGSDGRVLLHCHAGCSIDDVLRASGLERRDLFPAGSPLSGAGREKPASEAPAKAETPREPVIPRPLGELLNEVAKILRRYVVFPLQEQVSVIAAWIVHTWAFDAFDHTAYLFVFSAAKRSGKSRALEVIEQLAKNPRLTPGSSSAALMRSVDETNSPTMLLDEVDTIYSNKGNAEAENTRRFLNAGYKRGAKFLRCVGQGADIHVKEFPAFCPKALAGINRCLPDTVLDRSLPIELVRQSREKKAERFREREVRAIVAPIRAELEAIAQQPGLIDTLRDARPVIPEKLNDRVMDITEPLIAIGELAGGEWPERIRSALVKLYSQEEDADIGVKLLAAIKGIFEQTDADKLTTQDILEALVAIEDGPWALMFEDALKHDRLQTAASKLAKKLKPYKTPDGDKIKPCLVKLSDGSVSRGYHKADFLAAWERYLPRPLVLKAVTSVTGVTCEGKTVTPADSGNVTSLQGVTENTREGNASNGSNASTETGERGNKFDEFFDFENSFGVYPMGREASWICHGPKGAKPSHCAFPDCPLCEVCGETNRNDKRWWFNINTHAVRCLPCQEDRWMADGYEIDDWGLPWCWNSSHTRELRIAERERNYQVKTERWLAHREGRKPNIVEDERYGPGDGALRIRVLTPEEQQDRLIEEAKSLFHAVPSASH